MATDNLLSFRAMTFARHVHAEQKRKYTANPYADHLAEVCGIAMSVGWHIAEIHPDKFMATCWLHDCVEDQDVDPSELERQFGKEVMEGVMALSDLEVGPRFQRKAAARSRLARAPRWVQTIKVADLISNTASIVEHDPKFAEIYLSEKRLMLEVLTKANPELLALASDQLQQCEAKLGLAHAGQA
jgi:guanosine-3',5'-bis(diphosphate) 3'-pyrophosphohydrolase